MINQAFGSESQWLDLDFLVNLFQSETKTVFGGYLSPHLDQAHKGNSDKNLVRNSTRNRGFFFLSFPWFRLYLNSLFKKNEQSDAWILMYRAQTSNIKLDYTRKAFTHKG